MSLDLSKLEKVNQEGHKIEAQCPACFEKGEDKTGNHLVIYGEGPYGCVKYQDDDLHRKRIFELVGVKTEHQNGASQQPVTHRPQKLISDNTPRREVAAYPYTDENGTVIYEAVRYEPKDFRQRRILDGKQVWDLKGIDRLPYHLHEVIKSPVVWIVEGEKDADNLRALGLCATCRAGGASTWEQELTPWFANKDVILCGDNDAPGRTFMGKVEAALQGVAKSIRRATVTLPEPKSDISDFIAAQSDNDTAEDIRAKVEALICDPWEDWFKKRRFDVHNPPPKPVSVVTIAGKGVATAGNLVVILSQLKTGTSNFCGALMASTMNPTGDCLGITGLNPNGLPLLHFDTEQSEYDHHQICVQMLRRAGLDEPPPWFNSYWLTQDPVKDRRRAVAEAMRRFAISGKLWGVVIDGVGDLCVDLNDPTESFGLVEELHALAIAYYCTIFCRLHENPGDNKTGKTRGHLGSQLERKAETNLRLEKDSNEVVTVYTERSRHCHIPKDIGPCFAWNESAGMHLSRASGNVEKENAKAQEITGVLVRIFTSKPLLSYGELRTAIMENRGVTQRTAEKFIASLQPRYIHQTGSGLYGAKP